MEKTYYYDPPLYLKNWPNYYKVLSSHYVIHVNISKQPLVAVEMNGDELVQKHVDHCMATSDKVTFERHSEETLSRLLTMAHYD